MTIEKALAALDPNDDDHWTADGLPRVDAVAVLINGDVTRREITNAAPTLTRDSVIDPEEESEEEEEEEEEAPKESEKKPKWPEPSPAPTEADIKSYMETVREDEVELGNIKPLDDVVGLHPHQVYSDVDLVDRAIDEFGRQAEILAVRREVIRRKIDDVGRRGALLSKHRNRFPKDSGKSRQADILRMQEVSLAARTKRADAAKRFVEAGTTAKPNTPLFSPTGGVSCASGIQIEPP